MSIITFIIVVLGMFAAFSIGLWDCNKKSHNKEIEKLKKQVEQHRAELNVIYNLLLDLWAKY